MFRYSTITAAVLGITLALGALHSVSGATAKSSTTAKKKSGTSAKKKTATEDADSASAASGEKKTSGSNLDLPLPAKLPASEGSGASTNPKKAPTEKKSTPADKGETSADKSDAATEKKGTSSKTNGTEKKSAEGATSDSKTPEKPGADTTVKREHAPNATVEPETIAEFASQPPRVQQLMRDALDLTRLNLTYTFGSADPDKGGMDCSGTIYYLLHAHGFNDVARDSSGQYMWARKTGTFFPVVSKSAESSEFSDLQPGDLMFWTGTYETGRDIPISHVMLYMGKEKGTGKRIMFGASDGRSYNGIQRWGVSVFDFKMPKADPANPEKAKVDFVGYARIPGLRNGAAAAMETVAAAAKAEETPKPVSKSTAAKADTVPKPSSKSVGTAKSDDDSEPAPKSTAKAKADDEPKPAPKSTAASSRKKKGTSRKSE